MKNIDVGSVHCEGVSAVIRLGKQMHVTCEHVIVSGKITVERACSHQHHNSLQEAPKQLGSLDNLRCL